MALEDYDEVTGKAAKAADHAEGRGRPRRPPVTSVASAEEGLLVSLDRTGGVDLPFIATLYGKPEERDHRRAGRPDLPRPGDASLADRRRLPVGQRPRRSSPTAEAAGPAYARNAEALRHVQPEDVLPGDIDANLGAPWIPASDIQAFAAELFGVAALVHPGRPPEEGRGVERRRRLRRPRQSVAATAEYGTPRANGTWLLELALNMKTPVIYDTIQDGDREERVVNQEATLAAREKQKLIKERFKSWVFADPDRTERLVRLYNDTYNNLRPRLFDGSHLDFPGMSQDDHAEPAPEGRRLARHEQRQHAARPMPSAPARPSPWPPPA